MPVYDYALVSEPLTPGQRASIGWQRRQGLSDANNQFHYFRLTADDRILWGGYDAIHHRGSRVGPELDRRPATFERLEAQFLRAFPQLEGIAFPYRWGGAIDTTSRFTVTFGRLLGGRVLYALGYTGLGVGASRWAAGVVRDMILRPDEDRLRLRLVTSPPIPFPPEPLRSLAVDVVRHELDRADRDGGPARPDPANARRDRDRLRLLGRRHRLSPGRLAGQAGVVTQVGSSRASVASGSEPWPSTWSWNSRRSNRDPSRSAIWRRSAWIWRWPSM